MLVLVGIGLISAGICVSVIPLPHVEQIVFYVAGAICFIPGKLREYPARVGGSHSF